MKSKKKTRPYNMTTRAKAAARTEQDILEAAAELWRERALNDITLEAVAERAGVSVRTVLRKYGSKEQLFAASIEKDGSKIMAGRDQVPAGDVEEALSVLLRDYEKFGDASIRTLAVEEELEIARKILDTARTYHREWCARVFAPYLPAPGEATYESRLLAFIAATEFYLWKLLRRDLNRSYEETFNTFRLLVKSLVEN